MQDAGGAARTARGSRGHAVHPSASSNFSTPQHIDTATACCHYHCCCGAEAAAADRHWRLTNTSHPQRHLHGHPCKTTTTSTTTMVVATTPWTRPLANALVQQASTALPPASQPPIAPDNTTRQESTSLEVVNHRRQPSHHTHHTTPHTASRPATLHQPPHYVLQPTHAPLLK